MFESVTCSEWVVVDEFVKIGENECVIESVRVCVSTLDGVKRGSDSVTDSVPVEVTDRLPSSREKLTVTDRPDLVTVISVDTVNTVDTVTVSD